MAKFHAHLAVSKISYAWNWQFRRRPSGTSDRYNTSPSFQNGACIYAWLQQFWCSETRRLRNDGIIVAVSFDYTDGPRGPSRWGDLRPAWSLCKQGLQQSPMLITLDNMVADPRLGKLDATYTSQRVPSNISHDGHEVEVLQSLTSNSLLIRFSLFNVIFSFSKSFC